MKRNHRVLRGAIGASLLTSSMVLGCSFADTGAEGDTSAASEAIIAGVDAKSASLNAVGALAEVYRYEYVYCTSGSGTSKILTKAPTAASRKSGSYANSGVGRLDRVGDVHAAATAMSQPSGTGGTTSTTGVGGAGAGTSQGGAATGGANTGTGIGGASTGG
ncbi:MAG: hypothetical protein QM784_04805 [Polyangiaceae bacterium]